MNDPSTGTLERIQRLHEILLRHLQAAQRPSWPGADSLTFRDALTGYRHAVADGVVPGPDELLLRHPDLAEEIRAFFS